MSGLCLLTRATAIESSPAKSCSVWVFLLILNRHLPSTHRNFQPQSIEIQISCTLYKIGSSYRGAWSLAEMARPVSGSLGSGLGADPLHLSLGMLLSNGRTAYQKRHSIISTEIHQAYVLHLVLASTTTPLARPCLHF